MEDITRNIDVARRLAKTIGRYRQEIERLWLERVQKGLAPSTSIETTHLRDGMPNYLDGLVKLLCGAASTSIEPNAREVWSDVAREHGARVRVGFDIEQLVHEFVTLRHVIQDVASRRAATHTGPDALLADALDAAVSAALQAYVDARDHELRRRQ